MGYFRQPLRRRKCRDAVSEMLAGTALVGTGSLYAPRVRKEIYLRFSAGTDHPDTNHQNGIFHVGDDELHAGFTHSQKQILDESVMWFNENLVAPYLEERRAIFWFRPDNAGDCLTRIWDRVRLLRDNGIIVRMLRCTDPGMIVYRDAQQIAAIPQRRVRWRSRSL